MSTTAATTVHRHPVLGVVAGLLLGLGAAILLFAYGLLPLTVLWLAVLLVGGAVLGVVLAYVAPPRRRSG